MAVIAKCDIENITLSKTCSHNFKQKLLNNWYLMIATKFFFVGSVNNLFLYIYSKLSFC